MQTKRVIGGLILLLVCSMLALWMFWNGNSSASQSRTKSQNPSSVGQQQPPAIATVASTSSELPSEVASVETPKVPAVKASQSLPAASVNNWGMINFTDGVLVVRTLTTGETCIISPTLVNGSGGNEISVKMLIESPGSLTMSSAAIEALRGKDSRDFLNNEFRAAARDSTKVILSNPMVTAVSGTEVSITTGEFGSTNSITFRFTPIIDGSRTNGGTGTGSSSQTP